MELEEKMGTMSIPKLIISTSIPLTISLLINNLYNLVDSIFVAHISENALTGISMAAPMQMILIALGSGLAFSSTAVAIYGILLKVQNIAQIFVHGMYNALIPIVAYNFGARRKDRINESVRTTFLYAIVVMLAVVFLIECIPDKILLLFDASEKMLSLGVPAVRIMAVSFLVSSLSLVFAAIYQGFGKSIYSMWLSLIRQVILLIPFLALSVWMQKISIFWMAFVIAEVLAIPFGVGFYKKTVGLIDEMKE